MKQTSIKKILILASILMVPGFLYYLLQETGKNRYKPLAFYGPKKVANTFHSKRGKKIPDTIYHLVPDFKLLNQNSDTVSLHSYKGKILLVNLFYTNNQIGGMNESNAMKVFSNLYEKNKMVQCVSLSIDPVFDTPSVLSSYAKKLSANANKWNFLTGDSIAVHNLVKEGLLLDALKTVTNGQAKFTFSNMFVLIDTKHRIRGFYESNNKEAMSKLDDEIKVLIAEELINIHDGR